MKNLIILGLTSMLLFSVSAGLSLWLKQSKDEATAKKDETKKDEPAKKDEAKKEPEKADTHAKDDHGKPDAKAADKGHDGHGGETDDAVRKEKDRLLKRQEQIEIVLQDVREQQEKQADLSKKVSAEQLAIKERNAELETRATALEREKTALEKAADDAKKVTATVADAKKAAAEAAAAEARNLDKLVNVIEALPAEKAAQQLQEMANTGRLDTAVKLLGKMKDRQAAKVISEITDAAVATQLLDKMISARRPESK